MEFDITDILEDDSISDQDLLKKVLSEDDQENESDDDSNAVEAANSIDAHELLCRLRMWHENCKNLLIDLRTISYYASAEDSYVEFNDKQYYSDRLYFKIDPENPKDAKTIHATKQLCKIIGIPFSFFASCRPTLKMNVIRTWQAGLAEDTKKAQNNVSIRESKGCSIIRAFSPLTKFIIPLHEFIQIILDTITIPVTLDCVSGDNKDDLVLHARFMFEKEYNFHGAVCLGFAITASELNACPLTIDVLLHNKVSNTSCVASYGGEPFFKSDYTGLQPSSIKEVIPIMLNRLDEEIPEFFERMHGKQNESDFCAETSALEICRTKGLTSKMKKAIYHQVSECLDDVKNPWDLARHIGLVAKDFDALKRIQIERAVGTYLNLFFAKE